MLSEVEHAGVMDPVWSDEQKLEWCARRFIGWKCAVFQYQKPKMTRRVAIHGLIILLSPCGLINLLRVVEWFENHPGTVIANRGAVWDRPVSYWHDEPGFLWWATQVWLTDPSRRMIQLGQPFQVWKIMAKEAQELLHEATARIYQESELERSGVEGIAGSEGEECEAPSAEGD